MFARKLILRVLVALAIPEAAALYVTLVFFSFSPRVQAAIAVVFPVTLCAVNLAVCAYLAATARPVGAALEQGASLQAEARQRAASAAARLSGRTAAAVCALGAVCALVSVGVEVRLGIALDLGLAATGVGIAFTLMCAMAAYSGVSALTAPVVAELGSGELGGGRSMRGKVMILGFGLVACAALAFLSVSYAGFRADTDQDQLDETGAAQERAARVLAEQGPQAAAASLRELTNAPAAVVAGDGLVLAREGEWSEPPAAHALAEGVSLVSGGWSVQRATGGLWLVSEVRDEVLQPRRLAFFSRTLVFAILLFTSAGAVVWLGAAGLTAPIGLLGSAAARVASGDLTVSPPSLSRDEMGQLAADFRSMAKGLSGLVTDVQDASRGVEEGSCRMGRIGEQVQTGAHEERERVLAMGAAVEAMHGSVAQVGGGVEGLADHVRTTSAAVGEMAASLEEVRRQTSELEERMDAARSDVDRLSKAGRRAQSQIEQLESLAASVQRTLTAVSGSVSGLEMSAVAGQLAAAQAAELADHAGGVVTEAAQGIEDLRAAVDDAKRRVTVLGRRSDDIDKIIDFIGEVAGRTNLLSLNASIIATQAGEHGKAFAVVADQIRELASQISSSTKSIGEIIRATRDDVGGTARLIERGDALASRGVELTRRSLDALQELRIATFKGHETAAGIRTSVQEHTASTQDVSELVSSIADNTDSLSEAMQLVVTSVTAVGAVSRGAAALGEQVGRALAEQSTVGQRQLESLERIDGMLSEIKLAVGSHEQATGRVRDALAHLEHTVVQHESAVVELALVADGLGARSKALSDRVGRFKI